MMGMDHKQQIHCRATSVGVDQGTVVVDRRVGEETILVEVVHQVTRSTLGDQAFRFSRFPNRGVDHLVLRGTTATQTGVMILKMMTMN